MISPHGNSRRMLRLVLLALARIILSGRRIDTRLVQALHRCFRYRGAQRAVLQMAATRDGQALEARGPVRLPLYREGQQRDHPRTADGPNPEPGYAILRDRAGVGFAIGLLSFSISAELQIHA